MDTFRIKLPHPQTVENEEEFITNSGRKRKAGSNRTDSHSKEDLLTLNRSEDDMLGSGLSVLATHGAYQDREDLSNSVQAQLHLSLDRLSENYDPDDIKRLQDKKMSSRQWKQSGIPGLPSSKSPITSDIQKMKERNDISRDSLDVDSLNISQIVEENTFHNSEGSVTDNDDDIHTIVDDSLDISYDTNLEDTPVSHRADNDARNSNMKNPGTDGQGDTLEQADDKYASLRYDPNWIKTNAGKPAPPPVSPHMVVDFNNAPRLQESADLDSSGNVPPMIRTGGEITIHSSIFSTANVPQVRLSADPSRLRQTNALYEEEFAKLLEAQGIKEDSAETNNSLMQNQTILEHYNEDSEEVLSKQTPSQTGIAARSEVIIKPLDTPEDQISHTRSPEEAAMKNYLIEGYNPLPDRHRYIEHYESENSTDSLMKQTSPKASSRRGQTLPFEDIASDKKNPLGALSPRGKGANRRHLAPTPPKVPKPRNQKDYIELNKQRYNRKTNSASYLELHAKRSKQHDQQKMRSQSELRFEGKKTHSNQSQISNENEYDEFDDGSPKNIEDAWSRQAEKLKRMKSENLNKGKVFRPTPQQYNRNAQHSQVVTSPKRLQDAVTHAPDPASPRNRRQNLYNMQMVNAMTDEELNAYMQQQQHSKEIMQNPPFPSSFRHQLPLPSQNAYLPSIHFMNRNDAHIDVNAYNGIPTHQHFQPGYLELDQNSPKPYGLNPNMHDSADVSHAYFNEQHFSLPSQQEVSNRADVWSNPNASDHQQIGNEYAMLPPSQSPRNFSPRRKVTFLGDKISLNVDSLYNDQQAPVPVGDIYRLPKYKVPLPPTPPRKSQNSVRKDSFERSSFGKENVDAEGRQGTSYSILPPILKYGKQDTPLQTTLNQKNANTQRKEPGFNGSYYDKHEKNKQQPQYKVYTLDDYKCLKKESVKYGGLGPDRESVREKVEKLERTKKYAEFVRQQHKNNIVAKEKKMDSGELADYGYEVGNYQHHFSTTIDDNIRREQYDRRQRAIEYSKQIPRPKQKSESNVIQNNSAQSSLLPSRKSSHYSDLQISSPAQSGVKNLFDRVDFDFGTLQVLKDRHEREKAQVAAFAGNS